LPRATAGWTHRIWPISHVTLLAPDFADKPRLKRALLLSLSTLHEGACFIVAVLERRPTHRDRVVGNDRWYSLGTEYGAPSSDEAFGEALSFDARDCRLRR
jgi:hypothetical protein